MIDHNAALAPLPPARSLSRPRQLRLLAIGAAVMGGLLLLILVLRWLATPAPPPAPPADPPGTFRPTAGQRAALKLLTVGLDPNVVTTGATGTIAIDEDRSTPVALPYSGQVTQVYVEAGDPVQRGQALLQVQTGDFVDARNTLFAALSQRATAQSQLKVAEASVQRAGAIYREAGGALRDYQQAQNDLVAAQSAARSADAAVGAARDKLAILGKSAAEIDRIAAAGALSDLQAATVMRAPIAGQIAQRGVSPGQYVSTGDDKPAFTITDPTHVWLVAQVAESDAAIVHLGDEVAVTTPALPGRVYRARINNVGAALDPATHRLPVRASIYDPDGSLKPQMFASFAITKPGSDRAILLPASAVIREGEGARVWVLRRDGLLEARSVGVGDAGEAGQVSITHGLAPGDRVVTAGAIFVNEAGIGS